MAISAIGGASTAFQHLQVQGSTPPPGATPAASTTPTQTQSGTKIDRDGDYDNSTPAADASEGKGSNVNLTA